MNSKFLEGVDYSRLIKLYNNARFPELEQELKSLIRAHPLDFRLLNLSGICCYRLGQFERAIDQYKKAIKLSDNESKTRDYLIEPFFNMLGYDKMEHYSHEYSLRFSKGSVKKIDMVVSLNGRTPIMLVECKKATANLTDCLLYTSPSPRDQSGARMPSSG